MKHPAPHGMDSLLTSSGVEQKACMTVEFLQIKVQGYERLRTEIEQLKLKMEAERSGLLIA